MNRATTRYPPSSTRLLITLFAMIPFGIASAADGAIDMPVFAKEQRILFQGDSITDGNRGRSQDPNHILGHGYAFIIAARFGAAFPERNLTFINRGVSGNKVTDLAARWKADTLDLKPDLLSVLIGINDASFIINKKNPPLTAESYEQLYDQLLSDTKAALPTVRFVLGEPFQVPPDSNPARGIEVQKMQAAVERLAQKHHAPVVHFQKLFDAACQHAPAKYWVWDSVHPTYAGHQLLADEWVRTGDQFYRDGAAR